MAFFGQKTAKIEENWQNPNRLIKFSNIWYLDASQQKKMRRENFFPILAFFVFFGQKSGKIDLK